MKFLTPFIFLLAAVGVFYWVINPIYKDIQTLRLEKDQYVAALDRADKAATKRDQLLNTFNSISDNDLRRLQKFLPDNIDNIKLLIELSALGDKYDQTLKNIRISDSATGSRDNAVDPNAYSAVEITFGITLTYENYLKFLTDVQKNLRLTDITAVDFSSQEGNAYNYTITLKTYVMK
jgi:hypothetical protein